MQSPPLTSNTVTNATLYIEYRLYTAKDNITVNLMDSFFHFKRQIFGGTFTSMSIKRRTVTNIAIEAGDMVSTVSQEPQCAMFRHHAYLFTCRFEADKTVIYYCRRQPYFSIEPLSKTGYICIS